MYYTIGLRGWLWYGATGGMASGFTATLLTQSLMDALLKLSIAAQ